jgi:hypothetical protein
MKTKTGNVMTRLENQLLAEIAAMGFGCFCFGLGLVQLEPVMILIGVVLVGLGSA